MEREEKKLKTVRKIKEKIREEVPNLPNLLLNLKTDKSI